jgi:hypothetical protein
MLPPTIGAGHRWHGLGGYPPNFEISLDNLRPARKCRLAWTQDDLVGAAIGN